MNSKLYETLRWAIWVVMPAIATFLFTMNALWAWNLPIETILGTFEATELFLGTILGIAKVTNDKKDE